MGLVELLQAPGQTLNDRFRRVLERGDERFEAVVRVRGQADGWHNETAVGVRIRMIWQSV